jgi:alcohol dehydrogenase
LLPYVESFNLIGNLNRFRDIAEAMGKMSPGFLPMKLRLKLLTPSVA